MDAMVIQGPARLKGSVRVSGSKNSALPLLFSSLLFDQELTFRNVPRLWDIETTLHLLEHMGCEHRWDKEEGVIVLSPRVKRAEAPYEWVKKMRAGVLALGPLLARTGEAKVSLPGGCAIGARPVNYHLLALEKMGAKVEVQEGYIHASVDKLVGARIRFPEVTVTGTENILTVAAVAEGKTILENAAREPEVVALGELLIRAGVSIEGLGTSRIEIQGVSSLKLQNTEIVVPPDRIETGTWIAAAVATDSPLKIEGCDASEQTAIIAAFREMGVGVEIEKEGSIISVEPAQAPVPIHIVTEPYPGFATDMQAQMMLAMCKVPGRSTIREAIFENRYMHVAELRRLGAKIQIDGNLALIDGGRPLSGAPIMATDLRASASLVLAGLAAKGQTKISRIYHLDRGYQRLDEKLRALGANIQRITE